MSVSVNNSRSGVTVKDDKVTITVNGGIGPQGPAGAGGVTSLQGLSGALTLAAVGGTWSTAGSTITLTVTGGAGAVTSVAGRTGEVVLAVADVSGAVATTDSRLSDAREWSAATVTQAQAEAGTDTSRLAFTVLRVWQAIAAWWAASAAKVKLDGIAAGATANQTDAYLLSRANHTGTQAVGTITGLAAVATSGSASDLGTGTLPALRLPATAVTAGSYGSASSVATFTVDAAGRLTAAGSTAIAISAGAVSGLSAVATAGTFASLTSLPTTLAGYGITDGLTASSLATPPAIGGTTPAAGTFTIVSATSRANLPSGAAGTPVARDIYTVADTIRYRDSGNVERLLLNSADNLANLGNLATARTNLGLVTIASSGSGDDLTNASVTNAKLANVSTATIKGRTSAGSGSPEDLTGTQATAILDTFTSSAKGLAPASGGGTTNFLRADGTWAAPSGGGGVTDGSKGDIVVSSSGTVWMIAAGAVTEVDLANSAKDLIFPPFFFC